MEDLIVRSAAVKMLREKASGYFVSMFATSGECHVARVVATEAASEIANIPSANAVEVVRCKECVFGTRPLFANPEYRYCKLHEKHRKLDWFCADGRREK